jgi:peroxiredoxin
LSSSQHDRLGEIVLQVQGTSALGQPGLAGELALTTAQKQEITRISSAADAALTKIRQQAKGTQNLLELNRQAEKLQTDLQRDLIAAVTPDQRERWLALRGRDIDLKKLEPLIAMAPELRDVATWINSEPLTLERLRGQVVALHFWTFGCINCIHNYPSYKHWYEEFNGKGLTIVGVHTPETEGEKVVDTIRRRARENDLLFPIAVDGQLKNWQAWSNNIWPAVYLIDKKGHVRYWWYGELNWQGAEGEAYMRSKIIELMAEK